MCKSIFHLIYPVFHLRFLGFSLEETRKTHNLLRLFIIITSVHISWSTFNSNASSARNTRRYNIDKLCKSWMCILNLQVYCLTVSYGTKGACALARDPADASGSAVVPGTRNSADPALRFESFQGDTPTSPLH